MVQRLTISYAFDVAPHLRKLLELRARREERWQYLHEHDGRATFWQIAILSCIAFWVLVAYGLYSTF